MQYTLDKVFACKALSAKKRPLFAFVSFFAPRKEYVCNVFECESAVRACC